MISRKQARDNPLCFEHPLSLLSKRITPMISSLFRSLSIATLLIMGSAAHAQIIMVSNAGLDGTGEAYVEYSTFFGSTYHWDRAQSFTTGVGSYTLNSIDLKLV